MKTVTQHDAIREAFKDSFGTIAYNEKIDGTQRRRLVTSGRKDEEAAFALFLEFLVENKVDTSSIRLANRGPRYSSVTYDNGLFKKNLK